MVRGHNESDWHQRGFSLMELIVVVLILSILTSAVVPLFRESIKSMRENGARQEFLAVLKFAHERAVMQSLEYRVYIDDAEGAYWVEGVELPVPEESAGTGTAPAAPNAGGEEAEAFELPLIDPTKFVPIDGPFGSPQYLPEPLGFDRPQAQRDRDRDLHFVAFYGSGACDDATVVIENAETRGRMVVKTEGRLGQFEVEGPRR